MAISLCLLLEADAASSSPEARPPRFAILATYSCRLQAGLSKGTTQWDRVVLLGTPSMATPTGIRVLCPKTQPKHAPPGNLQSCKIIPRRTPVKADARRRPARHQDCFDDIRNYMDPHSVINALSNSTRADILALVSRRPMNLSQLAQATSINISSVFSAVSKLMAAGLVTKKRRGRQCLVRSRYSKIDLLLRDLD